MKKFTKLSLVAAVAVAGLSSANAKPLEEAIKDVDVSGTVTYRYDNFGDDKTGKETTQSNKYKINFNLSSKVNDYVKFNSRISVNNHKVGDNDFASLDRGESDANPSLTLAHAYFGLSVIPNTTVNVGKQGLATPWTVATDNDGGEQTGTGIFSVTAVDNFVLGLAYFNQTNINTTKPAGAHLSGAEDIYAATLQANYGIVNAEAWYLNTVDNFDTYTAAIHGKADLAENAKIGYEVRYVSLDAGDIAKSLDSNSLLRVAVDGKVGIVNARVAYTTTDKDGGLTALDTDAQNASLGWRLNSLGKADAKYLQATLGADILDNLNFSVHYGKLEFDAGTKTLDHNKTTKGAGETAKQDEIFGQLTYKMSKNLDGYIRYGKQDFDGVEENSGRLQVNYKF
ncbi:major outer membrane protein [Aliarcobacter skirrowii]|uniref:major outer membrane protein n=1 Tax=Aliarcobacter skirrowii TaxID=28200 RepID=UPI0029BD93E8|nr:major outer membrane protein [Aliarcobacter skirrowii]MDX3959677.1 major outer membrane protein [Aliarcobacter skirrowii]